MRANTILALAAGVVSATLGLAWAAPAPMQPKGGGQKKGAVKVLDGEWETVNVIRDGLETGGGFRGFTTLIKGKTFIILAEDTRVGGGTITVDLDKQPPTIDLTHSTGATWLGVYRLKGDSLRIACFPEVGKGRPKTVASKRGSGVTLYEYRRKKN